MEGTLLLQMASNQPKLRIGHGYDLHRLERVPPEGQGRPLVLAGVQLDHPMGPVSHSDGDVVLHAVTDAMLGAIGAEDIGQVFPDDDPGNEGRPSSDFLRAACQQVRTAGWSLVNLDITVICERPKLKTHKGAMISSIANVMACDPAQVNIKGKTHEGVDAVGEGRAIEVHVVALLQECDQ